MNPLFPLVGQIPSVQFLGWRLSLGNAFIILASRCVASDSLVSWKTAKFGASFYIPNVFVREVDDLKCTLRQEDGSLKYAIDIIVISAISLDELAHVSKQLAQYSAPQTTVLVCADFGCELEPVVLEHFAGKSKCVLSMFCEFESRQLSLGSFALVTNDNCLVHLGVTYQGTKVSDNDMLTQNKKAVHSELSEITSKINVFINLIEVSKWLHIKKVYSSNKMALKLWESIIPRVSLGIVSIIYDQFDYNALLATKSTLTIFKELVVELMHICYKQCDAYVARFLVAGKDFDINYNYIVEVCVNQKSNMVKSIKNEHPEYLALPLEAYCFYHRYQYPAHILLYQPITLAKKHHVPYSNLNFLFGFYVRLLSLSGLDIQGGQCQKNSMFFKKNPMLDPEENKLPLGQPDRYADPGTATHTISSELEKLYFDADGYSDSCDKVPAESGDASNTVDNPPSARSVETYESGSDAPTIDCSKDVPKQRSKVASVVLQGMAGVSSQRNKFDNFMQECSSDTNFEDRGVVGIPHYKSPFKQLKTRTGADNADDDESSLHSLERQLHNDRHLFAQDYDRVNRQLCGGPTAQTQTEHDSNRRRHAKRQLQIWRLQRKMNMRQTGSNRSNQGPYEDLINHVRILNQGNMGDILPFTTARFGGADTFRLLQGSKDQIISTFEQRARREQQAEEAAAAKDKGIPDGDKQGL